MVEHVLAKDETGVRFSYPAQINFFVLDKLWIKVCTVCIKDTFKNKIR